MTQEKLRVGVDTGATVKSGQPNISQALANNAERRHLSCVFSS